MGQSPPCILMLLTHCRGHGVRLYSHALSQLACPGRFRGMRLIGCSHQPSLKLGARQPQSRLCVSRQLDSIRTSPQPTLYSAPSTPLVPSLLHPPSLAVASIIQKRGHRGHSHHHHRHDNSYLISTNKKDAGVFITRVGLFVNLGMAISKGIGGWFFNSQVLLADALHALTDLVSDFMTLATVSWSLKPPTAKFPSGYGKVESLGSLGVSGILLVGGVIMGFHAIEALYFQFFLDAAAAAEHVGHSHSHMNFGPNVNAVWVAVGSIVVKEWLYRASKTSPHIREMTKVYRYVRDVSRC
jgi:Cation efflux family